MIFAIFIQDFGNALRIGINSARGLQKKFHTTHLNPKKLTSEQAKEAPILLIHGAAHTQGVWIPFSKKYRNAGGNNPLFTVNLPSGKVTHRDTELIDNKVREIQKLYRDAGVEPPPIHFVAYSRGGSALKKYAKWFAESKTNAAVNKVLGKLIFMGFSITESRQEGLRRVHGELFKKAHAIQSVKDYFDAKGDTITGTKTRTFHTTHLGLPHHKKLASVIKNWVSS